MKIIGQKHLYVYKTVIWYVNKKLSEGHGE